MTFGAMRCDTPIGHGSCAGCIAASGADEDSGLIEFFP
jgi:hypothetical protein